jgi:hypothetical protein
VLDCDVQSFFDKVSQSWLMRFIEHRIGDRRIIRLIANTTSRKFSLSPEQAMVFAEKDSPVYLAGAFDIVAAMIEGEQKVEHSFRTGGGVRWGDSAGCLFCARRVYANS